MDPKYHKAAAYTNHYDPDQNTETEVEEKDSISVSVPCPSDYQIL